MKHIYIIEDELKDLGDLLITLHAIIYSTKYKLNPKETKIHLIEIQWENEEIRKVEYDAEINKLCTRLTDCNIEIIEIEHKIVKMADIPDYEKRCSEFARIIYDTIGDFTPLYDEALTSTSIPSCRDGEKYVVMLDLILRTGKSRDEALCQARKKSLLTIYTRFLEMSGRFSIQSIPLRLCVVHGWIPPKSQETRGAER